MRRPGNILLLAILIGALASALVYRHLRSQELALQDALQHAQKSESAPSVTSVVVAKDTIAIGTQIDPAMVRVVPWPVDAPIDGTFSDPAKVAGHVARTRIDKNQPLTEDQMVGANAGLLALLITDGMRGMSVKVDNVTGVSGFITPDSHVDVLIALQPETGEVKERRSKVILQNIKVLASGTTIERKDNKPVEVPTVTLLVSPEDAEKLTLATREGPVQLALRNYRDDVMVNTAGATTATLFGKRTEAPAAAQPVRSERAERAPSYSVEILLGDRVTRQGLS